MVTVADISDTTGRFITYNIFKGNRHSDRKSSYRWPPQQQPSPLAWGLWRNTLCRTLCTRSGRLFIPLGNWFNQFPKPPKHQALYFSPGWVTHRLVEQTESGLLSRICYDQGHTTRTFQPSSIIAFTHPSQLSPVTISSR